jgi:tRNA modification GTPase
LSALSAGFDYTISCKTGHGIDKLMTAIGEFARTSIGDYSDGLVVSRARQAALLQIAHGALSRFLGAQALGIEFGAEELRVASDALGNVTGVIGSEDVLGAIFSSFCIGK